ncbi:MAG: ribose 5-phosphate isomerase B [Nitrospinae bacterium]|nr:ribose 5-phosphate isomerase B [Nitrospinota bacterium]
MNKEKIAIACDHAGYSLKLTIKELLTHKGFEVEDLGTNSSASVDYPDYGQLVAQKIVSEEVKRAILICGTGIGMSITANRFMGVRAALCNDSYSARMSRLHNDSNVLVIGGRVVGPALAEDIVSVWLDTAFEGGRHTRRVEKIDKDRVEKVVHRVVARYLDKIQEVDHQALEKMVEEAIDIVIGENSMAAKKGKKKGGG